VNHPQQIRTASTRSARIFECLESGPCTSADVAAILGITPRSARVGIWLLQSQGQVRSTGRSVPSTSGRPYLIYELTRRQTSTRKAGA
jgi:predicted ArsR family transcriptional regulator